MGRVAMLALPDHVSELVDRLGDLRVLKRVNGVAGASHGTEPQAGRAALPAADYPFGIIARTRSLNLIYNAILSGPSDGKVTVESTKPDGIADRIALPLTHTFPMLYPAVIRHTALFLVEGRFDPTLTHKAAVTDTLSGVQASGVPVSALPAKQSFREPFARASNRARKVSSAASSISSRSRSALCAPLVARINSSSFSWIAVVSRFWVFWIRNTIRKVTIVVPVLITSCHVLEKPKTGPVIIQAKTARQASKKVTGRPIARAMTFEMRV